MTPLWRQTIFQAPLPLSFLALPPFGCALICSTLFPLPYPCLTSLPRQTMLRRPGTHSSPPTDSFGCPSALFHPPAFIQRSNNLSTPSDSFRPPDPRSASPNDVQAAWDAFLAPYCLVRLPLSFVSPTSLCLMLQQPFRPSGSFAHPIPVQRRQKMFKRLGTHSSSSTASFGCPSALFHLPAFIRRSNNLSTPSGLFCPPDPRSALPNDVQAAWDVFLPRYCLVQLPLSFVSPTGLRLTLQQPFHPL